MLNSLSLPLYCLDTLDIALDTCASQQHHGIPLTSPCVLHATTRNLVENVSHVGYSPARLSVTPTGVCGKSAALPSTLVWVFGPHKPLSGSFRPQDMHVIPSPHLAAPPSGSHGNGRGWGVEALAFTLLGLLVTIYV